MRLHDDLQRLAHKAPPPPDPEMLLRRAQAVKARRAIIVSSAAVVAVLVITVSYLSRVDDPAGPAATFTFTIEAAAGGAPSQGPPGVGHQPDPAPPDRAELERAGRVLEARARFLGLSNVNVRIEDGRILLELEDKPRDFTVEELTKPGDLQVRKVLAEVDIITGEQAPTPSAATPSGKPASTLEELINKLGVEVYERALRLTERGDPQHLPGFESLTPQEVALLPPSIQLYVPTISCSQIGSRPRPAAARIVICAGHDSMKLLLDRAALTGADLTDAMVVNDTVSGGYPYQVLLSLTPAGQLTWTEVSSQAAGASGCEPGTGASHCSLAFLVDGEPVSTPEILRPLTADEAQLGSFADETVARLLAAKLGPRELPSGVKLAP